MLRPYKERVDTLGTVLNFACLHACPVHVFLDDEKSSPFFFCGILKLLLKRVQNMFAGGEKSPPFFFSKTNLDSQPLLPCFIYRFGWSL